MTDRQRLQPEVHSAVEWAVTFWWRILRDPISMITKTEGTEFSNFRRGRGFIFLNDIAAVVPERRILRVPGWQHINGLLTIRQLVATRASR
jgi:hypothetical protein